jgi:glycerol dehydrogenase-like iron-containing ADH family enzyme
MAGPGAWAEAAKLLAALPQPIGLAGEADLLRRFRKPLSEAWLEAGLDIVLLPLPDGVECCKEQALTLAYAAEAKACVTLIGFGGGKALDLAKWASQIRPMILVTAPTSAATCAAASAVVVAHRPDGSFEGVLDLPRAAALCIVDFDALKEAPGPLLAAGMADTLAKWLEWGALEASPQGFGSGAAWILAERGALACEALGAEALKDPGGAAWATCVEACLLWSAQASCLGSAPAAAAHSLANALTGQPAGRTLSHGAQVGLGLLWQEALLAQQGKSVWASARLAAVLEAWGCPVQLPPGLDLEALIEAALAPGESVHSLGGDLSSVSAKQALQALIP